MAHEHDARDLLAADVALSRGAAEARDLTAALIRRRDGKGVDAPTFEKELAQSAHIPADVLSRICAEIDRVLDEAGGDSRLALSLRGGVDPSLSEALGAGDGRSQVPSSPESGGRTPLRTVPRDRYVEFARIGIGGMGVVYAARDTELNRPVAVKLARTGVDEESEKAPSHPLDEPRPAEGSTQAREFEGLKARLVQEAWLTGMLEHPGIAPVHEVGQTAAGVPYYTMRYVPGKRTLADAIAARRTAPFAERLPLLEAFLRVCDAAHYAHDRGVVHRDLKPANVALGAYGEVVVLDWGLASFKGRDDVSASAWGRRLEALREESGLRSIEGGVVGTVGYMAPEAANGRLHEVDRRSDVYGLGVILYEILTGRLPYGCTELPEFRALQAKIDPKPPRSLDPTVPEALSALCFRSLSRAKTDRPESARAIAEAIRAWQAQDAGDRELDARLAAAKAALDGAKTLTSSARLTQVDRALAAIAELETKRPERADVRSLREEAEALREEGVQERERAAARRTRRRVGIGVALVLAVAGPVAAGVYESRRRDAADALAKVLRLSDAKEARDLVAEEAALWPVHPDRAPAMKAWLDRAHTLVQRRPAHEATLAELRARAATPPAHMTAGPREWRFADDATAWQYQVVSDLVDDLGRLSDPRDEKAGLISVVAARHEEIAILERRLAADDAALWKETIGAIAASPRYGGLRIRPQLGLMPLGKDPASGLFEFAHLQSGSVPTRHPETGQLHYRDDAGVVLVLIPGGTFAMGAQNADPGGPNFDPRAEPGEQPVHRVSLSAFFLAKHEFTQAQWKRLTGDDPSFNGGGKNPRKPVEQVSWDECARWLPRWSLDLPTEAQREYACRAGTSSPWVTDLAELVRGAWYSENTSHPANRMSIRGATQNVGTRDANPFGLFDMQGNVWEWCRDPLATYDARDVTDPLVEDPAGPTGRGDRVTRGGSWFEFEDSLRVSARHGSPPDYRCFTYGVRAARRLTVD